MTKKPIKIDEEAYGMDCRPGPSKMPQSYFDAVFPPEMAALIKADREKSKAKK